MLNPFPIMWLSLLAYFILRVAVGLTLIHQGLTHSRYKKELVLSVSWLTPSTVAAGIKVMIFTELALGLAITAGWHTQYACLVGMVFAIKMLLLRPRFHTDLLPSRHYYILLLGIFCSLFITGAGAFAFDLPL